MNKTLYVLEQPWDENDRLVEWSMRPFISGLAKREDWRFLYRTFASPAELKNLVCKQVPSKNKSRHRWLAYISTHGDGGRIGISYGKHNANIAPIARASSRIFKGVWISACDVGNSGKALISFLTRGGAFWVGGYSCGIEWDAAAQIDQSIVLAAMRAREPSRVEQVFSSALGKFSPTWIVSAKGHEKVCLRDAIRIYARAEGQGNKPRNITEEVIARAWTRRGQS